MQGLGHKFMTRAPAPFIPIKNLYMPMEKSSITKRIISYAISSLQSCFLIVIKVIESMMFEIIYISNYTCAV